MKIRSGIFILIACYTATLLRVFINNNFIVSIIGSLFFGFVIAKRLSYSKQKILFSGFGGDQARPSPSDSDGTDCAIPMCWICGS